jgi:transcriptional regulator EpsA
LLRIIQQASSIRRHLEVFLWLNGELQNFFPHDILIAAWGDFKNNTLFFDVISAMPGVRTSRIQAAQLTPLMSRLYAGWVGHGGAPYTIAIEDGLVAMPPSSGSAPARALCEMRSAVVHGVKDIRGDNDCLYAALSAASFGHPARMRSTLTLLLPHLDLALRRLDHVRPQGLQGAAAPIKVPQVMPTSPEPISSLGMSLRELEIMTWVREGKTNQEIGQILDISVFTVKNHLQRIFKKLNVYNRAQAVAQMIPGVRKERVQ